MIKYGNRLVRIFSSSRGWTSDFKKSSSGCSPVERFLSPNRPLAGEYLTLKFSSQVNLPSVVEYTDVKKHIENRTALVVDVRNPKELVDDGELQGSVLIPLNEVKHAFALPPEIFEKKYQVEKPGFNSPIIFSCLIGKRSATAECIVKGLGFKNTSNYLGSFSDWREQEK